MLFAFPANALEVKVIEISGMKVWLAEDHTLPMITLSLGLRDAGSASDKIETQGLAFMTTRLLDQGAGELNAKSYTEAVESQAAEIGFGILNDMLTAQLSTLSDRKEEAMRLFALALLEPRFDEDAISRTREQLLTELKRMEENPGYIAGRTFGAQAFPDHPYGRPARGNAEHIAAYKREDFKRFMQHHLGKDRVMLAVSGDITETELTRWIEAGLGKIPDKAEAADAVAETTIRKQPQLTHVEKSIPQTVITLGFPAVKRSDPDYYAAYILNHILGGDLGSRLSSEIREKRGLAYSAGSDMDALLHTAYLTADFSTRSEKADEALQAAREVMATLAEKGVSEQEFRDAQQYIMGSYPLQLDSNRKLAGFMMALQLHGLTSDYIAKRNDYFRAVTREQVNQLARKLFSDGAFVVVTVGKADKETDKKE